MNVQTWEPVYEAIRRDFGYARAADERARDVLRDFLHPFDLDRFDLEGATVAIAGGAEMAATDLERIRNADTVFAASNAVSVLQERGRSVDCMISDLDKVPAIARDLTGQGTPVAVHAHGDNIKELRRWVPEMDVEHVLGTTQVQPAPPVRNFGGFTDGDRGAFLADHLGASRLLFPGWDFDDPTVSETKRRKLQWAGRLLRWLESRRGDRFDVLDGHRSTFDISDLPV